ncbi:hypothetical protein F5144DRAFT_656358 [Chaetomium tenue]|uniref:Uncharacterized protein n=1 Tax=Chaetomium tenue TaxID=1854479 RepID=A0ACB7P159_9PEZI|nr:hypothetical protein F5144DRAFT_656358 [Chaetomium globosum]
MPSIWSCSSCAVVLVFAVLGRDASASHVGREWRDVHRIPKAQITAHLGLMRRDDGACPTEHTSCAPSLNGGCCPSRYACAVDSCYATTAGPTTACGQAGYYACTVNGQTVTETETAVTVITPTIPTETAYDTGAAVKFIPTSVPKVPASSPSSESNGGLSGGAIGGIIAGVVVLLIVVIVAAFLIIRRLKQVEDVMESKRGSSSGKKTQSQSQAQKEHYGRQLHSDMDDMSVDPLMVPPSVTTANNSTSPTPQPGGGGAASSRGRADSAGFTPSPNMFPDDRSRHASPDFSAGYFDVPPGPAHFYNTAAAASLQQQPMQAARIRASTDSASTTHHRGYAYTHWRQQSNASELSADGSDHNGGMASPYFSPTGAPTATTGMPELDGSGGFVELPGAIAAGGGGGHGPGPAVTHHNTGVRSRSSSNTSIGGGGRGHVRRRSDSVQGPGGNGGGGQGGLDAAGLEPLDEGAEIHGYYGRRDQQAGQTAAGLDGGGLWEGSGGEYHHPGGGQPPQGPQGS